MSQSIRAARDALNRAYGQSDAPWPLIAEAVDWQRRALEQMIGLEPRGELASSKKRGAQ